MKAIIVFDIDDKYAKKLEELEVEYHVYHYENGEDIDEGRIEPKPMPQKRKAIGILNDYERGKILGFNSCLENLLKETEE